MAARGVLILVVLSLLFLFVLIAITYVLVATRQLSSSKQFAKTSITGDLPEVQLNKAMMQVLRGDAGIVDPRRPQRSRKNFIPRSARTACWKACTGRIRFWDRSIKLPPTEVTHADATGGQIVEFTANTNPTIATPRSMQIAGHTHSVRNQLTVDGFLDGCVITMTSGPAKGLSSRIVRYEVGTLPPAAPNSPPDDIGNPVFHVMAFMGDIVPEE